MLWTPCCVLLDKRCGFGYYNWTNAFEERKVEERFEPNNYVDSLI